MLAAFNENINVIPIMKLCKLLLFICVSVVLINNSIFVDLFIFYIFIRVIYLK